MLHAIVGFLLTKMQILNRKGEALNIDDVDFVLSVNFRGVIDLVRQAAVHLAKVEPEGPDGERGVVILVSSSSAYDGQYGQVAYAATKGAVASMALPMSRDLASWGIRVVAIAPSLFNTNLTAGMSDRVRKAIEDTFVFPNRAGNPPDFSILVSAFKFGLNFAEINVRLHRSSTLLKIPC